MKKFVFLVIAVLLVLSLAGCGSDNGTDENGNGDGNGTESAQWSAYAFGETVKPKSGGSGKIDTFTIESVYSDEEGVREFKIQGSYMGTETLQATMQKTVLNLSTYQYTFENVTNSVVCHRVKHRVTVLRDDTGDTHPAWAEVTVWIPTAGQYQTTTAWLWLYPRATYEDSEGHQGEVNYYLTDAMINEMTNPPAGTQVSYQPVASQGDFRGYDGWAFHGLYGYGWFWFQAFAKGGAQELKEGSWGGAGYGCTYNCTKLNKTIGSYTFSAWSMEYSCTAEGSTGGYKGVFSEDLPLPMYARFGSSGAGTSTYWEYTLTDLELE